MTEISLQGKVIVITGGGRGMGREMAVACARAGAKGVVITAAPGSDETAGAIEAEINEAIAAIEAAGGAALGVLADVGSWDDCRRVVAETRAAFGGLHVLINNAGKSGRYVATGEARRVPFFEADPQGYCEVNKTNIDGPFLMARAAAAEMLAAGWGRILNVSKSVDAMHRPFNTPYGPSKAALEAATIAWAEDLFGTGITVNAISPGGAVNTRFGDGEITGRGLPADVMVPCLMWLLSAEADAVTGCRYEAHRWDDALAPAAAAEACREAAIFPVPRRETKLTLAWIPSSG
jgi:NAD(P)-dependent dehydrogenase (short-subunit alcohol dehydrogenase family)